MFFIENKEVEQFEDFEIDEQVLNNLTPEEKILYKIKTIKSIFSSKSIKIMFQILAVILIIENLIFVILRGLEYFTNPISLLLLIFMPIMLGGFYFFNKKVLNKPKSEHLYITNKKLFKIYGEKGGGTVKILHLDDIQAISFIKTKRFTKNFDIEITSERINYYSRYSKGRSYNFPIIQDLPNIIKILESILWHYGNLKERLESRKDKYDIRIPHKFFDSKFSSTITLYDNKITYEKKDSIIEIPFNQDFYITYQPWTKTSGFVYIRTSYDSPEKIKVKLDETYLQVIEIIYLYLLSWKYKNNLLFDNKSLAKFQTQPSSIKLEPIIHEKKLEIDAVDVTQEFLEPYRKHIKEGEKILFYYIPKVVNRTLIILSILTVLGIFAFVCAINFVYHPPIEGFLIAIVIFLGLFMFGPIFGIAGPFYILIYLSDRFSKYVFTSEKIILRQFSKIGYTPYSNISSITYNDIRKSQHIHIELKEPIISDQFKDKTALYLSFTPKKLELYEKIQSLRKKFMVNE